MKQFWTIFVFIFFFVFVFVGTFLGIQLMGGKHWTLVEICDLVNQHSRPNKHTNNKKLLDIFSVVHSFVIGLSIFQSRHTQYFPPFTLKFMWIDKFRLEFWRPNNVGPPKLELIIFHNICSSGCCIVDRLNNSRLTNSWKKCKFHARYNNTTFEKCMLPPSSSPPGFRYFQIVWCNLTKQYTTWLNHCGLQANKRTWKYIKWGTTT